jgi:predicted PolB exonuclease-like 3'-5' exonuclease
MYGLADKDELIVIRSDESLDVQSGSDSLDNELTDVVSILFCMGE